MKLKGRKQGFMVHGLVSLDQHLLVTEMGNADDHRTPDWSSKFVGQMDDLMGTGNMYGRSI